MRTTFLSDLGKRPEGVVALHLPSHSYRRRSEAEGAFFRIARDENPCLGDTQKFARVAGLYVSLKVRIIRMNWIDASPKMQAKKQAIVLFTAFSMCRPLHLL